MVIVSDGDIEPSDTTVARRLPNIASKKQALNKYKYLQSATPHYQGISQSIALDLKIITYNISRSESKKLTSLKLDIKGEERPKEFYLQAIDNFIKDCRHPGGMYSSPLPTKISPCHQFFIFF